MDAPVTAEQFQYALAMLGWTQARAARELGVSRHSVHRWANGRWPVPQMAADLLDRLVIEAERDNEAAAG